VSYCTALFVSYCTALIPAISASFLTEPSAFKSYEKIADICDNLLLQVIFLLEFLYLSLLWVFFFFFFFLDKHQDRSRPQDRPRKARRAVREVSGGNFIVSETFFRSSAYLCCVCLVAENM
jgi:hypothetical protein